MTTTRWTLALEMPLPAWAVSFAVAAFVASWTGSSLFGTLTFVLLCLPWVSRKPADG